MTPPQGPWQQGGYQQYPQGQYPQQGGYPQYPQGDPYAVVQGAGAPPWTVNVMFWIGVVAPVVATVLDVLNFVFLQNFVNQKFGSVIARSGEAPNSPQVASIQHSLSGIVVVISGVFFAFCLILTVLWMLFAFKMRAGRNWARITLTVFASLWCLYALYTLINASSGGFLLGTLLMGLHPPISLLMDKLVDGIVGLLSMGTFLGLAFHKLSNGYFRSSRLS